MSDGNKAGKAFSLVMHPGTQPWTMTPENVRILQDYFAPLGGRARVDVYPSSRAKEVTGIDLPDGSYRAVTRGNHSICFVNNGETHTSLAWLIAHELTHQLVDTVPVMEKAFSDAKAQDPGLHPADDQYHQVDAEERFCDGIATRLIGQRLDRDWWRKRTGAAPDIPARFGSLPESVRCLC